MKNEQLVKDEAEISFTGVQPSLLRMHNFQSPQDSTVSAATHLKFPSGSFIASFEDAAPLTLGQHGLPVGIRN